MGTESESVSAVLDDYHYLCCNCGFITRYEEWSFWEHDEDGNLVPKDPGDYDRSRRLHVCRCPVCQWDHTDDDSNPGIYDGKLAVVQAERARLAEDDVWLDLWADVATGEQR